MKASSKKIRSNKKTPGAAVPVPDVDIAQLERLLDFMAAHGLEEFEYQQGDLRIRLRKAAVGSSAASQNAPQPEAPSNPPRTAEMPPVHAAEGSGAGGSTAAPAPAEDLHVIKSPIVGTFYTAAGPEAQAFVKIGDDIDEGQAVCTVEAMKLMNEIEADVSGDIVRVLAENGQPVEYGQPLFAVRPAKAK